MNNKSYVSVNWEINSIFSGAKIMGEAEKLTAIGEKCRKYSFVWI